MVKPPALPMPWIGGGGITVVAASSTCASNFAVKVREQRDQILALGFLAHRPVVQHHVGNAGAGQRRVIVEDGDAADRDHVHDAGRCLGDVGDLRQDPIGALERCAVGHLHVDHQVALVLDWE